MQGRLRVFLGAAPGVGKTFAMLEEAHRLSHENHDVVIALVETHGRHATASLIDGLERVPCAEHIHEGLTLSELDVDAVIARAPEIAVVDEFAHSTVPGSRNSKRWQDIQELLDAGIHVLTTVNIQHIESLNDVVEQITGIVQRETVPDTVLRSANQIELVDIAPQALRDRLSEGNVYPAERIDAALSNYFRLGNLTALRELALLWLADEVDSALKTYRADHKIDHRWEARERVVVALTGGPEGETLLRRGARIAARSAGGELHAVHVNQNDGLQRSNSAVLAQLRSLVDTLGGTFHQVVGDDIPTALVEFASGLNATQLVIGLTRKNRVQSFLTGPGIGHAIIKAAGGIDVHIVNHAAASARGPISSHRTSILSPRRLALGFVFALLGGALLTALLVSLRSPESIIGDVLAYQLLVILVAVIGGRWPALYAAVLSGISLDYFFIEPYYTVSIGHPLHALALVLYIINALLVSFVVDLAARRLAIARRSRAESELLAAVAGSVFRGDDALTALVSQTREAFSLSSVELLNDGKIVVSSVAEHADQPQPASFTDPIVERCDVGYGCELVLRGQQFEASNQRMLSAIIVQIQAVIEHQELEETAQSIKPLERNDQVRSALLSAVSHDLRRPLAAAVASVTALNSRDVEWDDNDRDELLDTAEVSLATLTDLVTNLLDTTRLQAGVLALSVRPVDADDVIGAALDELEFGPSDVTLDLDESISPVLADSSLLQRAVVNVLTNAKRYSPAGSLIRVTTSGIHDRVEIRVIDHGPGLSPEKKNQVFVPFQRLGDVDNTTGLGLGLALSRGFVEGMGGSLDIEDTPGGGVTMVISLQCFNELSE
ncbi:ATP-binding protein [Timonella sp. A28]|uniref:ATP-binding protein n=1 Tax=Timonella sp. A28 TaxID=3442640 RepID=UPI003EB8C298